VDYVTMITYVTDTIFGLADVYDRGCVFFSL